MDGALTNARAMVEVLIERGHRIVSGGTDNHLFLLDLTGKDVTGKDADAALGRAHITVNKNAIPFDPNPPLKPSGVRFGTPALTTRGMAEAEMRQIATWIASALEHRNDDAKLRGIHGEVTELADRFPLYGWLREDHVTGPQREAALVS